MYARCRIIVNFFCINKKNEENKQDLQKSPKAESEGKSPFACPSERANSQGFKQKCHYFLKKDARFETFSQHREKKQNFLSNANKNIIMQSFFSDRKKEHYLQNLLHFAIIVKKIPL